MTADWPQCVADHTRLVLNTPCWGVSMTALLVIIAIFIALASGLPLSSIFGAGSGSGFFNLPLIF